MSSMNVFPAQLGTLMILRERGAKEATLMPVVGWIHVQGSMAFPICPMAHGGLTRGRAVVTSPDGLVTDPSYGIVCKNVDEWMVLTNSKGYWEKEATPGYDKLLGDQGLAPRTAPPIDDGDDAGEAAYRHSEKLANGAAEQRRVIPDRPARTRAPRKFKTNSWWKSRDPSAKLIGMIEGGQPVPHEDDGQWEKSGIVEYKELKKSGWTVVDAVTNGALYAKPTIDDDEDLI